MNFELLLASFTHIFGACILMLIVFSVASLLLRTFWPQKTTFKADLIDMCIVAAIYLVLGTALKYTNTEQSSILMIALMMPIISMRQTAKSPSLFFRAAYAALTTTLMVGFALLISQWI